MDTEEVVEMIDAITEGESFSATWQTETDPLNFATDPDKFSFYDNGDFTFLCRDPRTAREIAGALVAWANRKEGDPLSKTIQRRTVQAIVGDTWNEEVGTTDVVNESNKYQVNEMLARENTSREDWYHRNVGRMTRETIERNMKDLKAIQKSLPFASPEAVDIQKALNILHDSLMGIEPPTDV